MAISFKGYIIKNLFLKIKTFLFIFILFCFLVLFICTFMSSLPGQDLNMAAPTRGRPAPCRTKQLFLEDYNKSSFHRCTILINDISQKCILSEAHWPNELKNFVFICHNDQTIHGKITLQLNRVCHSCYGMTKFSPFFHMNTYSSLRDAALSNEHRDLSVSSLPLSRSGLGSKLLRCWAAILDLALNERRQKRLFGWNGTVNERNFPAAPTPVITRFTPLLPLPVNVPDSPFEGSFDEQIVFGGDRSGGPVKYNFLYSYLNRTSEIWSRQRRQAWKYYVFNIAQVNRPRSLFRDLLDGVRSVIKRSNVRERPEYFSQTFNNFVTSFRSKSMILTKRVIGQIYFPLRCNAKPAA